jgi:hypothetical protein
MQGSAPKLANRFALVGLLMVLFILSWVNVLYPLVRLSFQFANYGAFALAQLIPIKIIRLANSWSGWSRWPALIIGVLLLLPALPLGFGAVGYAALSVPADRSFERRAAVPTRFGMIAVYRTNGGATTAFGIVVRQECTVVPGFAIVRQLAHEYPSTEAHVEWQAPGTVRISFEYGTDQSPLINVRTFRLRRLCWGGAV